MRTKSLLTAVCIFCSRYSFAEELFDVVVVGGGAAGLAAAVSAAENGSKVILLEKGLRVGGNAYFSGGYYNAVDPELQKKAGIQDSEELFPTLTPDLSRNLREPRLHRGSQTL